MKKVRKRLLLFIIIFGVLIWLLLRYKPGLITEIPREIKKISEKQDEKIEKFINPNERHLMSQAKERELFNNLPEDLKIHTYKYPESRSSIVLYEKYKNDNSPIDISKEIKDMDRQNRGRNSLPYFNQWDTRWGFKKVEEGFFLNSGCGPTTLSMVYVGLTKDPSLNPYDMARKAYKAGYYKDSIGSYHTLFTKFASNNLGLKGRQIERSERSIKNAIDNGKIVVLLVRHNGIGDFTMGGHFMIITDYQDKLVTILDANSYNNTNKKWDIDRVLLQTEKVFELSK